MKRISIPSQADLARLVAENLSIKVIAERYGVHPRTVTKWRKKYGLFDTAQTGRPPGRKNYQKRTVPAGPSEHRERFIPIQERFERALKAKARNLGQPIAWIRSVWIKAHPEFMREMP